jgi:fermentation-respiration switch protein FrsA (DUF1100 family)
VTRNVIAAALLLALLFALLVLLTWRFQERIAFQPPRGPWPAAPHGLRVDYKATDGQALFAFLVGERNAPNGLLISFHGNADLAVWQIDWAEELARRTGITVMLAEYRGYMGLSGRSGYMESQRDADAAYRFAVDSLRVPPDRIALFGHSMGSAVATELAMRQPVASLILQSPFTSAHDMARRMTGYRPPDFLWRVISRLHYDTGARVSQIEAPVSVVHGGRDRLIPVEMGQRVYAAAANKGTWLLVPEATHNDVAIRGGEAYWSWIAEALKPVMVSPVGQRSP